MGHSASVFSSNRIERIRNKVVLGSGSAEYLDGLAKQQGLGTGGLTLQLRGGSAISLCGRPELTRGAGASNGAIGRLAR